jgi:predicted ATPase
MKFSGKNFQPWPDFDIDIEGLTIVIGPSNEGKSSIYRALRGILRNDINEGYIRNPKKEPLELKL